MKIEINENEKVFLLKINFEGDKIATQSRTQKVSIQECLGALELAKDQLLENVRKKRQTVFVPDKD